LKPVTLTNGRASMLTKVDLLSGWQPQKTSDCFDCATPPAC
jgi:hypothetical protein